MSRTNHIGVKIFLFFFRPVQRLPLRFHYFCGRLFAWVAKNLLHYRRDVVITNLSRSFPGKKYKEITKIANGFYSHLGEIFAEAMWFGGCARKPEKLHRQHICETRGLGAVAESFASGKSVMLLDSHFGNWEILGGAFQYIYGYDGPPIIKEEDICVVYKQLKSPFWDEFCRLNRCAVLSPGYNGYTESRSVLRYAVRNRDSHKVYIFPTDQFPYKGAGQHDIPSFMGQPTKVMTGAASLACKLGMAVYYMGNDRKEQGSYEMNFKKICDDASTMSPEAVMENFYAFLEEDVRRNPENYLWSHKRWK